MSVVQKEAEKEKAIHEDSIDKERKLRI